MTLTFLNPTSTVQVDAVPAFPVGALTGTRVALIDNSKENAGYLLGVVGQRLVERFGGNVDGELLVCGRERGHGHACAVERNAVTESYVVEIAVGRDDAESLAVG